MWEIIKNFFSKKSSSSGENFDNSTRIVKTKSGKKIEVYNDWPDEMGNVIADCFNSGKTFSGKIEDGKVTLDK